MNRNIIILACVCITIAVAVGLVWPKYQEYQFNLQEVKRIDSEISNIQTRTQNINDVMAQIESQRENFSKAEAAVPSDPSIPSMFIFLQQAADSSGIILKDIQMSGSAEGSSKSETAKKQEATENFLSLSLSGSYASFKNFLSVLENSARLIDDTRVSFNSSKDSQIFSFGVTLKVHSY